MNVTRIAGRALVVATLVLGSCSATAVTPAGATAAGDDADRGLQWLHRHAHVEGADLTELASTLADIDRQLGHPSTLRWVTPLVRHARAAARRDRDPQARALARLLGRAPTPTSAPADTGANTVTKLVTIALWCRRYPAPAGFDAALAAARDATVVTVTAAAGASQLLVDQGCRTAADLAAPRRALARTLARLVRRMPVGDASLQAAAMLLALGRRDLLPPGWRNRVLHAQRADGSWPAGTAPGSSRRAWRATAWGVRALVASDRPGPIRLAPPASEAPARQATTPPARPMGTVRPEDLAALHALAVRGTRTISEPRGGTPFGTHPEHDHAPVAPDDPSVRAARDAQLASATHAAAALHTIADASAAGYVRGSAFIPGAGAHWIKWDLVDRPFDPARPSMLLYDGDGADAHLVGFSYVVRNRGGPPAGFAGAADRWHQHYAICFANGRLVGSDILSTGDCRVLGLMTSSTPGAVTSDLLSGRDLWMLHAWIVPGVVNPDGVFAPTNGAVQCATCPPWLAGDELG